MKIKVVYKDDFKDDDRKEFEMRFDMNKYGNGCILEMNSIKEIAEFMEPLITHDVCVPGKDYNGYGIYSSLEPSKKEIFNLIIGVGYRF